MRVGILGGSFNPPHCGHLQLCEYAKRSLALDKILLIPTGEHPFKRRVGTSKQNRFEMTKLLAQSMSGYEASDIEIKKDSPSYTYETLKYLTDTADDEYFFISGSDVVFQFTWWMNFRGLAELCTFVCAARSGMDNSPLLSEAEKLNRAFGARIILLEDYSPEKISSSEIRENISAFRDKIEPAVWDYIVGHRLYGMGGAE